MEYVWTDHDCATTLSISGVLDAEAAEELRPVMATLVAARQLLVTIDLSALELLEPPGISALASLYRRLRDVGTRLCIEGARGQPLALIRLLSLDQYFDEAYERAPA